MNDAASKPALIQEFELPTDVVRRCPLAATHDDRPEEQIALADEAASNRTAVELGTPDRDVRCGGLLQPPDRIGSKLRSIRVVGPDTEASGSTQSSRPPARSRRSPESPPTNQRRCSRAFAFVDSDGTVIKKGGSIDIRIDKINTGEYCLLMNPSPSTFAPIVATIQGPDLTAGLINVNTSFGSDCKFHGGVRLPGKGGAGVA